MYKHEMYNTVVNRLYYSCFYAVSGLLAKDGHHTKTHSGTIRLFGVHCVQTGVATLEMARFYSEVFSRRQKGDYEEYIAFTQEEVTPLLASASEFIKEIEKLIYRN